MSIAPATTEIGAGVRQAGVGALASFWYYRTEDMEQVIRRHFGTLDVPVMADSGAWSAFSKGAKVDVAEYADWLHRWRHLFSVYVNLDVINDHVGSARNQRYLEGRGLAPLPVWHARSPMPVLHEMAARYDYLGIGGVAKDRESSYLPRLVNAHRVLVEHGARAHGFGITSWRAMSQLPAWRTCDSTTWTAGSRYGAQLIFTDRGLWQCRRPNLHRYEAHLRRLGFSLPEAVAATRGDATLSRRIAVAALGQAQATIRTRRHRDFVVHLAGLM